MSLPGLENTHPGAQVLCLGKSAPRHKGRALTLSPCVGAVPYALGPQLNEPSSVLAHGVKTTAQTSTHPCAQEPWPQFMSNEIFMTYGKN